MSLFKNTSALGVTPEDIGGMPAWMRSVYRSLVQISPCRWLSTPSRQEFSDLIRISGLSHGTDVWLGNAQTLIEQGTGNDFHCDLYPR